MSTLSYVINIVESKTPTIIKKTQIQESVQAQRLKVFEALQDEGLDVNHELVILQLLYFLLDGMDAKLCTEEFQVAQRSKLQQLVTRKACKLYYDYFKTLPDLEYLLPIDSSTEEMDLLQAAINGESKSMIQLSELFQSQSNELACEYWAVKAFSGDDLEQSGV